MKTDFVFPKNNEEEFIEIAEKLDFDSICFVYNIDKFKKIKQKKFNTNIKIEYGVLADVKNIRKARNLSKYVLVKATDNNRHIIENNKNIILFGLGMSYNKDFIHQRRSGLNHIICNLANKNNITVGLSFSLLLRMDELPRAKMIGRIKQNIRLCKKYKVKILVGSFSDSPFELRNMKDLDSLFLI